MNRRFGLIGIAGSALAMLGGAAPAHALVRESGPRVAVQFVKVSHGSADAKAEFQEAVAGGLAAAGADVLPAAETKKSIAKKAGLSTCATASCLKAIGEITGAGFVVRGWIDVLGSTYNIKLEMVEVATGKTDVQSDRCEVCTQKDAFEATSLSASALKSRVFKPEPVAPPTPPGGGIEIPVISLDGGSGGPGGSDHDGALVQRGPQPPEPVRPSRVLPWVGVGVGVAAIAAGAVLLAKNGDGTCTKATPQSRCPEKYNTLAGGIALLAGGVAAAGWGGFTLIFAEAPATEQPTAVPIGLGAWGRF